MQKFQGEKFWRLSKTLEAMSGAINVNPTHPSVNTAIEGESAGIFGQHLERVSADCQAIGLEFSLLHIERMQRELASQKCIFKSYIDMVKVLQERIEDEMSLSLFFHVSKNRALFYEGIDLFGGLVTANFPTATFDIEESGKCYATGRNTACVMHLMRVMELGLKATGIALAIPNPDQANWQRIIDQINSQINQRRAAKSPEWLVAEPFYADVSAHLFAVKVAWRNPSMHLEAKYDEQEAKRIYNAVEGFMQHLTTHLDELGNFTS